MPNSAKLKVGTPAGRCMQKEEQHSPAESSKVQQVSSRQMYGSWPYGNAVSLVSLYLSISLSVSLYTCKKKKSRIASSMQRRRMLRV
jgi:hypothetical protein